MTSIYIYVYIDIERICIQLYVNNTIQYKPVPFNTLNTLCLNQYLQSTCTNVQRPSPGSCFDSKHTAGCFVLGWYITSILMLLPNSLTSHNMISIHIDKMA